MNYFSMQLIMAGSALLCATGAFAQTQNSTYNYEYDANGNLTKVIDPLVHAINFGYDKLNRQTTRMTDNLGTVKFSYDGLDHAAQVIDQRSLATNYAITGTGSRTELASPDSGASAWTFDSAGNMLSSRDAKGQTTKYYYDVLNRVTEVQLADGTTITYLYDVGPNAIGRLARVTDSSGGIDYAYDEFGRVASEVRKIGTGVYTTRYQYDEGGHLAALVYPSGRICEFTYDDAGRIATIVTEKSSNRVILVSQVDYMPFGGIRAVTFGNGSMYSRTYDLDGRVSSYTLNGKVQTLKYDAAGRLSGIDDAGTTANSITYGYDIESRLTSALTPTLGWNFSYDAVGNRTKSVLNSSTSTLTYGTASNRLIQVGAGQVITSDVNGSIQSNGRATFQFDVSGKMASATTAAGTVNYRANSLGQRVQKITPSSSTAYHYDRGGRLIAENTGPLMVEYVYLEDLPVAILK